MNANTFFRMMLNTAAFLALTATTAVAYDFVPGSGGINANPYANAARRTTPRYAPAPAYVMPAPRPAPMYAAPRVVVPATPLVPAPAPVAAIPAAPVTTPEVCVHCGH